jgi:type IV secretory pathway VirB2 component (pilin)
MKRLFLPTLLLLLSLPSLALAVEFTPLTSIPAFQDIASSPNLSAVLNNIYRICIGIAAALAVLQLVRAGIMYMGGDSVTNKKEAKDLILMSLLGLLLVLSPVIVFSIINPDILSLRINTSSLAPSDAGALQNANMNGPAGGGTLTAAQARERMVQALRDAGDACEVPISGPQAECAMTAFENNTGEARNTAMMACLPPMTQPQLQCILSDLARAF